MYTIDFRDWDPGVLPDEASRPGFLIRRNGEYFFPVAISISNTTLGALGSGLGTHEETARQRVLRRCPSEAPRSPDRGLSAGAAGGGIGEETDFGLEPHSSPVGAPLVGRTVLRTRMKQNRGRCWMTGDGCAS